MSRRGSQGDNRKVLLLDTSFLLPILGFETSEDVMGAFRELHGYTLYYSDISLLEASWKIVKVIHTDEEIRRVIEGVRAIRETMNLVPVNERALELAMKMYGLGHRDMIDNLLYSMAITGEMRLLTVDVELLRFVEEHGLPRGQIVTPEELGD